VFFSFVAVAFTEPVELFLLLGVKAIVEGDQLWVLRLQGRKPRFKETLPESKTPVCWRRERLFFKRSTRLIQYAAGFFVG
jgi:hypothetical protein